MRTRMGVARSRIWSAGSHPAEPFGRRRATRNGYWLVTPKAGRLPQPCRIFRTWLKAQIAAAGFGTEREAPPPGSGPPPAA